MSVRHTERANLACFIQIDRIPRALLLLLLLVLSAMPTSAPVPPSTSTDGAAPQVNFDFLWSEYAVQVDQLKAYNDTSCEIFPQPGNIQHMNTWLHVCVRIRGDAVRCHAVQ